jgi:hypothetical protein
MPRPAPRKNSLPPAGRLRRAAARARGWGSWALLLGSCAIGSLVSVPARAQEPLNLPAPLARSASPGPKISAGQAALLVQSAQRAEEMGFPSIAAGIYRQLLEASDEDRTALTLALVTALLDLGQGPEAEQALDALTGPRSAAWHLRAALTAMQVKKIEVARAEELVIKGQELSGQDPAWYNYLEAILAEVVQDVPRANDFYGRAERAATSEFARVRFLLARQRTRVQMRGPVTREMADETRRFYERNQGRLPGYEAARQYAVMLEALKRHDEAVQFLQNVLSALPAEERGWADDFRLVLGFIADPSRELAGRTALTVLLETGVDRDRQRMALQLLADAAAKAAALRGPFRTELDKLIAGAPPHPILSSLLLFRAQVALTSRDSAGYTQAEKDAQRLLTDVQNPALRVQAYGVLAASAWEQRRYRTAANAAQKARAELTAVTEPGEVATRFRFGVLEAEARFRAGANTGGDASDFRSSADAYGAVLHERGVVLKPGEFSGFMFQRVLAEIRAGAPENAEPLLDEFARDPTLQSPADLENRWQAEWNLSVALQVAGKTGEAYARVNRLLAPGALANAALNPELRARMAWLQARLALEAGEPDRALQLVDALAALPVGLDEALTTEIASSGALLKVRAKFRRGEIARENKHPAEAKADEDAALEMLKKVRTDFDKSEAAIVYSYIVEADFDASPAPDRPGEDQRPGEAQRLLINLADKYPKNSYAPYALFKAALQAERLGQQKNFEEANAIIERLVTQYPQSDLVFDARFLQGDLCRLMSQFSKALFAYEDLINRYPQREDLLLVRLALAACHNAQASADPSHADRALELYAEVRDRADDRYLDARVEAGFNYGLILAQRGQAAKALEAWWKDVIGAFVLNDPLVAAKVLDQTSKARFWLARTLIEAGDLSVKQGNLPEAQRAWQLILTTHLPGETQAREQLKHYGAAAPAP